MARTTKDSQGGRHERDAEQESVEIVRGEGPFSADFILDRMSDPGGFIDKEFRNFCAEKLRMLELERSRQNWGELNNDERVALVGEIYRTYLEHYHRLRHDGSSYFYNHLSGTVDFLIKEMGLVGLATIVAGFKHDNLEDLKDKRVIEEAENQAKAGFRRKEGWSEQEFLRQRDKYVLFARINARKSEERRLSSELVDPELYSLMLTEEFIDKNLEQLTRAVNIYVNGMTKIKRAKEEATAEATLEKLLTVTREAVRIIYLKLADRAHNISTIEGHGNDAKGLAKQERIMRESEEQYLPMARVFRIRKAVQFYVARCCRFFNPGLVADFEKLAAERMGSLEIAQKNLIRSLLQSVDLDDHGCQIDEIQFLPLDLSQYTEYEERSFSELCISDIKVGEFDPMQEILITFNIDEEKEAKIIKEAEESAIKELAGNVNKSRKGKKSIKAGKDDSQPDLDKLIQTRTKEKFYRFKLKILRLIASKIEQDFAPTEKCKVTPEIPPISDPESIMGMKIRCYNPEFGRLRFRINAAHDEVRSKRGLLADSTISETPEDVKAMINAILTVGKGIRALARRELLQPRITVKTPENETFILPKGSTAIDFAAAIHGELLLYMDKVLMFQDVNSMEPGEQVDPFAPLEDGKVYLIKIDRSKIKVTPEWLLFARSVASSVIKGYLSKMPDGESYDGLKYLNRLSEIFNISRENLFAVLRKKYKEKSESRIVEEVGRGTIDPVLILAEHIKATEESLKKYVWKMKTVADMKKRGCPKEEIQKIVDEKVAKVQFDRWEIEVETPEEAGSLHRFTQEFSRDVGIKIDWMKKHKPGRYGKPGTMTFVFDLKDAGVGIYEFFVKMIKLNFGWKVKIAFPMENKIEKKNFRKAREKEEEWEESEMIVE